MNKFQKKFQKNYGKISNSLVIGQGFGHIDDILEMSLNVFLYDDSSMECRHKKLIRRQSLSDITECQIIDVAFIDRNKVDKLDELRPILTRFRCMVVIEGIDPISKTENLPLYQYGYIYISHSSDYHVYKKS
jgi:hypothetical protein